MKQVFQQLNIHLSDEQIAKFEIYCSLLMEYSAKFNLTAIKERDLIVTRHFADSIMGESVFPLNATVCDIGTGAGFPGLPLLIARPDLDVTLMDSTAKKIDFINIVLKAIGEQAHTVACRIEEAKELREHFDVVTSRAVAALPTLLEYAAPLVKVGGLVVAYKSDDSELAPASNAMSLLKLQHESTYKYTIDDVERVLLVFRKTDFTPAVYPRQGNKPRKNPL